MTLPDKDSGCQSSCSPKKDSPKKVIEVESSDDEAEVSIKAELPEQDAEPQQYEQYVRQVRPTNTSDKCPTIRTITIQPKPNNQNQIRLLNGTIVNGTILPRITLTGSGATWKTIPLRSGKTLTPISLTNGNLISRSQIVTIPAKVPAKQRKGFIIIIITIIL